MKGSFLASKQNGLMAVIMMMLLITLSSASEDHLKDPHSQALIKRAMVQAGSGLGSGSGSSSGSISHAAIGLSGADTSSASGLYDVWPNGSERKPKDLGAYHARQRILHEHQPRPFPTEPFPLYPSDSAPSPSPSKSPASAPAPGPRAGIEVGGAHSSKKTLVHNKPIPKSTSDASNSGSGKAATMAGVAAGATALALQGGRGGKDNAAIKKGGVRSRRITKSQQGEQLSKRATVPVGGSGTNTGSGTVGGGAYSGSQVHSASHTSPSGKYGRWSNGESGRPLHPSERKLFRPYIPVAGAPYQIDEPQVHVPPKFKNKGHSSSPAPAPVPAAGPTSRRLLSEQYPKKSRLREKRG